MVDQLTEEGEGAEYRRRLKIKIAVAKNINVGFGKDVERKIKLPRCPCSDATVQKLDGELATRTSDALKAPSNKHQKD